MKKLIVIAVFQARTGKEGVLREALTGLVAPTRKESGCINYDLHASSEDPHKFLFHETWESKAQLDAHLASAHIKALLPRLEELCVGFPQITLWERLD